jgi:hypothetical protein
LAFVRVQDLNGLAVVTVPAYDQRIRQQYGLIPAIADIKNIDDVYEAANDVALGRSAAFL